MAGAACWRAKACVQNSPLLVAAEVREVEGKDKSVNTLLSLATAIEEDWLRELFPEDLAAAPRVFYDADHQARLCRGAAPLPRPGHRHAAGRAAAGGRRRPPAGRGGARRPIDPQRLGPRRRTMDSAPESAQPVVPGTGAARPSPTKTAATWSSRFATARSAARTSRTSPVKAVVTSWLSPAQQQLARQACPRAPHAGQRPHPRVAYEHGDPPHIALRIQELYDVNTTPRIAMGRVPVLVHILAPNHAPGADHPGPRRLLARTIPARETGAAAQIPAPRVALNHPPAARFQLQPNVNPWREAHWRRSRNVRLLTRALRTPHESLTGCSRRRQSAHSSRGEDSADCRRRLLEYESRVSSRQRLPPAAFAGGRDMKRFRLTIPGSTPRPTPSPHRISPPYPHRLVLCKLCRGPAVRIRWGYGGGMPAGVP